VVLLAQIIKQLLLRDEVKDTERKMPHVLLRESTVFSVFGHIYVQRSSLLKGKLENSETEGSLFWLTNYKRLFWAK
jgi:hypothetical protein